MIRDILRSAHSRCKRYQDRRSPTRQDHPGHQLGKLLAHARRLGIPDGLRLDIGGGDGRYRTALTDAGGRVLELDRFGAPQVDLLADAHFLPIQGGVVGLVALVEVLEHLKDPLTVLRECGRALQPGGMVVITTPQYWHVHGHPSDYYRFTDAGLRYLCEEAGLTVVDCWSRGGPALIIFHTIECSLSERWRPLFVIPCYPLAEWVDQRLYDHRPSGSHYDALGWSLLARKL